MTASQTKTSVPMLALLRKAVEATEPGTGLANGIAQWVIHYGMDFGINLPIKEGTSAAKSLAKMRGQHSAADRIADRPMWSLIRSAILSKQQNDTGSANSSDVVPLIGRMLGLEDIDQSILDIMIRYFTDSQFEQLWDIIMSGCRQPQEMHLKELSVWSAFTGHVPDDIIRRFDDDAPLIQSGAVLHGSNRECRLSYSILRCMSFKAPSAQDLQRTIVGKPEIAQLGWRDYDHIAVDRDRVLRILKGALQTQAVGINILVYGPPGTGKTEFCKTVSAKLGQPIYAIGEKNEHGEEPDSQTRLQHLALSQRMICRGDPLLLMFDEAEDVLQGSTMFARLFGVNSNDSRSRVFLHTLLDHTPAPTLWVANSVSSFSDAVLRRMTFALELRVPPQRVRERIWREHLAKTGMNIAEADVSQLAREFETAPAMVASAIKAANLTSGGIADIRSCIASVGKIMSKPVLSLPAYTDHYETSLVNADIDVIAIAESLVESEARNGFSMCLFGPPGTGKSAYAAYLAQILDMPLLRKSGSDLLAKYVGETERNISNAFDEAEATGAILLFDEADSFLGCRKSAVRSWEITQVNEMLSRMERHRLPFICTTNLAEKLDEAAARRFLFKIRFNFLRADQLRKAFLTFFKLDPPKELETLTSLTPAEFSIVRRKVVLLGIDFDETLIFQLLRQENTLKKQVQHSPDILSTNSSYRM